MNSKSKCNEVSVYAQQHVSVYEQQHVSVYAQQIIMTFGEDPDQNFSQVNIFLLVQSYNLLH